MDRVTPVALYENARLESRGPIPYPFLIPTRIRLDRIASADEVAITMHVVDACDGWPEFVVA